MNITDSNDTLLFELYNARNALAAVTTMGSDFMRVIYQQRIDRIIAELRRRGAFSEES